MDSGAAEHFMDIAMASRLQVPVNPLSSPLEIIALDGRSITPGSFTKITDPLIVSVSHHLESMFFYLISSPELPLIPWHPWLMRHNPELGVTVPRLMPKES